MAVREEPRGPLPPAWTVTAATLAAIVSRAFGVSSVLVDARPIGGGTVNDAMLIDVAGWPPAILRIAPSEADAAAGPGWLTTRGLRREQAVIAHLPHLAGILPPTIATDFTRTLIDRDWVIQGLVGGRPWSELAGFLTIEQQADLWRQTGALTRSIHDVKGRQFGEVEGSEPGARSMHWSEIVRADGSSLLGDAGRFGLDPTLMERLYGAVDKHAPTLDIVSRPSLIHSDLDPRHLLVEPDAAGRHRICGLIDLEFGRFADPLSESLIVAMALDPPPAACQVAFREGYGPYPETPGAETRALVYQAITLGWGLTDLARLDRREGMPAIADALQKILGRLDGS